MYIVSDNATQAWESWFSVLCEMHKAGFKQPSRVGNVVGEVLNAHTVIKNPRKGIVLSETRKMPMKYAVGELLWYLSGSNKLSDIAPYAKFWENISDDGVTLNSAYGYRIFEYFGFNQWEHIKKLLKEDPYSRQAIIHIKDASNKPTKDLPCTISLHYQIRDNLLHSTAYMRSNDIWLGFPYDVFAFTSLQVKLAMELGVDLGFYNHIAGSLHLYENNVPKELVKHG